MLVLIALLLLVPPAVAQEIPTPYGPADGLVRLNERWFDLRHPAPDYMADQEFIPLNRVPWIDAILEADPALNAAGVPWAVVHIKAQPQASRNIFDQFLRDHEPIPDPPAWARLPGHRIRGSDGSPYGVQIMPEGPVPPYTVQCGSLGGVPEMHCFLIAEYRKRCLPSVAFWSR